VLRSAEIVPGGARARSAGKGLRLGSLRLASSGRPDTLRPLEPRYPFVAVDVPAEEADEISAALFDLGALGVEERDDHTLNRGAIASFVTVVGSFSTLDDANGAIEALREGSPGLAPRLEEVVGDAWRDAWKEHFAPFELTPRITVVPPWVKPRPAPPEGGLLLELEPGRAFGTGLHASTALIAQILDASAPALRGSEVLDVGTGSGILALVALLYGAERALAIDIDPDVIDVVNENAARNNLASRVEAQVGTAASVTRTFPWVLANIEARVLRPIAGDLVRVLAPRGTLVLSGILESEHDEMVRLYTSLPRRLDHVTTRSSSTAERGGGRALPSPSPSQHAGGEGWVAIAFSVSS
jgi:ribosomal protein L11 methyltransferase